jgi:hypothetical protein
MINPQKGILITQIIIIIIISRILFAVTIFQHSPLTRRVFYRHNSTQHHQEGEREATSSTSWIIDWHIYKSSEVFLIISNNIIHNMEME